MAVSSKVTGRNDCERWFERRSYDHAQFADLDSLAARKRELEVDVTVVLPGREVAATVGTIIDEVQALNDRAPLVDQIVMIDAGSHDGSAEIARGSGAEVYDEGELLPAFGPALGKGDAMWRALSVARGDVVAYLDSDTTDFGPHFVCGVLGPLLTDPGVAFVKALYSRPLAVEGQHVPEGGARVTELMAKPLFNLFYPELALFAQPLAGEMAATRELLCSIPFLTGYAVEAAMLIDILEAIGLDRMAQVDLGRRSNRNQPLLELGRMSYAVLRGVASRLERDGMLSRMDGGAVAGGEFDVPGAEDYVRGLRSSDGLRLDRTAVEVVERPPMSLVIAEADR